MSAQSDHRADDPSDPAPDPPPASPPPGPPFDPQSWTGPWADDARRLFQVLQGALNAEDHPSDCTFCPLCQGIAVIRRSGPDLLDRVSELATGLAATLRNLDDQGDPGNRSQAGSEPASATRPAPPPGTVRIDVTD